jgi:AraC-like DNA-binding protein
VPSVLPESQRYNHFPAMPMCALFWRLSGEAELLEGTRAHADAARSPVPPTIFVGPADQPSVSYNPGPVHSFALLLMPDVMHALTGLDLGEHLNRRTPAEQALPADWLPLLDAVRQAASDAQRVALIEAFLLPRWAAARASGAVSVHPTQDWLQGLAVRAAAIGWGRSPRQAERRVRAWVGQSMRSLRLFTRSEQTLFSVVDAVEAGELNWTEQALKNGYADQAHLCRDAKRVTGHSPVELQRALPHDETLWTYRLWL